MQRLPQAGMQSAECTLVACAAALQWYDCRSAIVAVRFPGVASSLFITWITGIANSISNVACKMRCTLQAEATGEIVAIPAENGKPVTPGQVTHLTLARSRMLLVHCWVYLNENPVLGGILQRGVSNKYLVIHCILSGITTATMLTQA